MGGLLAALDCSTTLISKANPVGLSKLSPALPAKANPPKTVEQVACGARRYLTVTSTNAGVPGFPTSSNGVSL